MNILLLFFLWKMNKYYTRNLVRIRSSKLSQLINLVMRSCNSNLVAC
uniref:Uncharacterized protein n=1 Tax=Arundo donax TaxID=35708 RepID=A0A0A9H9T8_ARUDO